MKKKSKKRTWTMWGIIFKDYWGDWKISLHETKDHCKFYRDSFRDNLGESVIKEVLITEV